MPDFQEARGENRSRQNDPPIALALLEFGYRTRGEAFWRWMVTGCPYCGRHHWHGAGPLDGDPRLFLGHRNQYCGLAGYHLVDAQPDRTRDGVAFMRAALIEAPGMDTANVCSDGAGSGGKN